MARDTPRIEIRARARGGYQVAAIRSESDPDLPLFACWRSWDSWRAPFGRYEGRLSFPRRSLAAAEKLAAKWERELAEQLAAYYARCQEIDNASTPGCTKESGA